MQNYVQHNDDIPSSEICNRWIRSLFISKMRFATLDRNASGFCITRYLQASISSLIYLTMLKRIKRIYPSPDHSCHQFSNNNGFYLHNVRKCVYNDFINIFLQFFSIVFMPFTHKRHTNNGKSSVHCFNYNNPLSVHE